MQRSIERCLCGLVALVLLGAIPATAAEPVNLLSNGGFEEGLAEWTPEAGQTLSSEPATAHSGNACVTAEVSEPNRAFTLTRKVRVAAGNRYRFEIWARATNRTKLVLWVVPPGSQTRQMVAAFENVPQRWRKLETPVPVEADGMLELRVVAPSSHGAPPGKIWIDDLALYETRMPAITNVSEDTGFNDEPTMTAAADGSLYVAYNSYRDGADSIQLARLEREGREFHRLGAWQVVGGAGTYVLGPRIVPAEKGVVLLYASEKEKRWDIQAVPCGPDGPGEPVALTRDAAVDVKPAAAWHGGTLWVAWESNRNGPRQIMVASLRDGKVSPPEALSSPQDSSYDPTLTVLQSGQVAVAWHAFRDGNYDVYLRRTSQNGSWTEERRLTTAPTVDRHAALFHRGDELWIAYENAQTEKYNIGRTNRRRLFVAKVTEEGLMAPKDASANPPLAERCEAAVPAFDSSGRLWLAMLKPRLPRAGWDVFVTCHAGDRWMTPEPVSPMKGMDRTPSLVPGGKGLFVASQGDDAPQSWTDLDQMAKSTSNILLAAVEPDPMPELLPIQLEPLVESDEPFEPAQIRVERGEDTPTPTISYQGQTLKLFYGDLHEHSEVSVCNRTGDQSINESYQHMRDIVRHDFACVTDHGYNINPYLWGYTAKQARVHEDPNRFLTFLAEEWTSTFEEYSEKHPYGFYGHRNLILADPYFPRWWNARNRQTPAELWEDLRLLNANFVNIPHQLADTGNVPTDWDFADEAAQPVAEIFQTRGSYEYKGTPREAPRTTPGPGNFIQDAWARGIVIGVIASPDHGGGYGKACVYAPELTREAVLDAIRARHCFGTTAAKIFLDVRVDGHLMGETVATPAPKTVKVEIRARCPAEIDRIEVCRNNQFIYTNTPDGTQADVAFVDRDPLEGRSYYYVRLIQKDEEIAWASPVWFGAE
jgi:hypothetical protein